MCFVVNSLVHQVSLVLVLSSLVALLFAPKLHIRTY